MGKRLEASVIRLSAYKDEKPLWDEYYVYDYNIDQKLYGDDLVARANRTALAKEMGREDIPSARASSEYWFKRALESGPDPGDAQLLTDEELEKLGDEAEDDDTIPHREVINLEEAILSPPKVIEVNGYYLIRHDAYDDLKEALENYPVLDDEILSELESDSIYKEWESWGYEEAIQLIAEYLGIDEDDLKDLVDKYEAAKDHLFVAVRETVDAESDSTSTYLPISSADPEEVIDKWLQEITNSSTWAPELESANKEFLRELLKLVLRGENPEEAKRFFSTNVTLVSKTFFV